jgi:DNA-binding NarL/FixJ family response regulator
MHRPEPHPTPSRRAETELAWFSGQQPIVAVNLEQVLKEEFWIRREEEKPEEGPSSVVLCANTGERLSEGVERARKLYPDVPVLVFGPGPDLPLARAALEAGARGYVHARMKPDQLVRALRVASSGEIVAPRKLLEYLVAEETSTMETANLDALSPRQQEILGLVANGLSNAQIAKRLYLSESTIKQHLRATYKSLRVKNRAQAASLFRRTVNHRGK